MYDAIKKTKSNGKTKESICGRKECYINDTQYLYILQNELTIFIRVMGDIFLVHHLFSFMMLGVWSMCVSVCVLLFIFISKSEAIVNVDTIRYTPSTVQ